MSNQIAGLIVTALSLAPPSLRDTGVADRFLKSVAAEARTAGDRIMPLCGYARAWLRGHRTRNRLGSIAAHVEEFGRYADWPVDMSFHGQIEVTGLRQAGLRATSMRIKARGGLSADLGVPEPGAKEDMSDSA